MGNDDGSALRLAAVFIDLESWTAAIEWVPYLLENLALPPNVAAAHYFAPRLAPK